MSRWLRIHTQFLQCLELQYAHFDKVIDDEGVLLGRVFFFFWLLPLFFIEYFTEQFAH